jgi:hypothetical protein
MLEAGLSSLSLEPALQRQPPPVVSAVPVPVSYGAYGAPPPPQLLAPSHFQQSATDIMQDPAIMSFRFLFSNSNNIFIPHCWICNFYTDIMQDPAIMSFRFIFLQHYLFTLPLDNGYLTFIPLVFT